MNTRDHEVGGRRGTARCSDLPAKDTPCREYQERGPFPAAPSRTRRAPFNATGSPGRWLHRYRADPLAVRGLHRTRWVLSTFPCTPSPAVLWVLCHLAPRGG